MTHLAAFNWGVLRHDWADPRIAEFRDNLERVNTLAHRSDGFIWQLPEAEMDAAQTDPEGVLGGNPRFASTLSVWRDAECLHRFAFHTLHGRFWAKRENWFDQDQGLRLVLWYVPEGHLPSIEEAAAKVDHLRQCGESAAAFGWQWLGLSSGRDQRREG